MLDPSAGITYTHHTPPTLRCARMPVFMEHTTAWPATVTQDKDNFGRAENGLFLPFWVAFYDTFPVVSFFLLNVV